MISRLLRETAVDTPDAPLLLGAAGGLTYRDADASATRLARVLRRRGLERIAFHQADSPELVLALYAAARAGIETCVVDHNSSRDELTALAARFRWPVMVAGVEVPECAQAILRLSELIEEADSADEIESQIEEVEPREDPDARVMILTTGTTGPPKGALYTWSRLVHQARRRDAYSGTRWLLAYHLNHFAGMQMLVHVLVNHASLVIPRTPAVADAVEAMFDHRVDCISATPTFWRFILNRCSRDDLRKLPLRQITLGGEASSDKLLELLRETFPAADISHVFATTEAGSCFSVRDREQGFSEAVLERDEAADVRLKIVDGELYIKSKHGMLGYFGEEEHANPSWRRTGDLVEVRDGRIHFVGRSSEVINVGGVKVHPLPVEEVVSAVPGVELAHVYGKENPVAGRIVAVDVVPSAGVDAESLKDRIRHACLDALSGHARPRLIRIVDEIELKNRKVVRRAG